MLFIQSLVTLFIAYISFQLGEGFGRTRSRSSVSERRKSLGSAFLVSFAFALIVASALGAHNENCSRTDTGIECDTVTDSHPSKGERVDKFLATLSICFLPYLVGFEKGLKKGAYSEEERRVLDRMA